MNSLVMHYNGLRLAAAVGRGVFFKVKRVIEYPEHETETNLTAQLSSVTAVVGSFF